LATGGQLAILHHPMYAGIILPAYGSLLLYAAWTTLFLTCIVLQICVRTQSEAAVLAVEFGA
jgi:protein-S-isoprenylcysteine O-methyltransferase Ste14